MSLSHPHGRCVSCTHVHADAAPVLESPETMLDQKVEQTLWQAVLEHSTPDRRQVLQAVGAGTVLAALHSIFPVGMARSMAQDRVGALEVRDLTVGFIPITCATPIIMAEPLGFYRRYGLNATVRRASSWALIRDWAINREVQAAHMLSPMPLALTLGLGAQAKPFYAAAIENTNGQAITLHNRHRGVRNARDMRGFRFCVPFPYSMHNYLLRYFLAEAGLHPDRDVEIRFVPPPEMVANLRANNVDGYLAPDPFNQRAVYEGVGYLYMLSREIWDGHPCCAFAVSKEFVDASPNSFMALFKSIVDATHYASRPENRVEIAQALAPPNYLNQPRDLLEQVLTGRFPDGLGNNRVVPNRINFDPFPWHSMAVWILTQMKRWNQISGDIDYKRIAEEVYLAADCDRVARELGYPAHQQTYSRHTILGASFDADHAEDYVNSFPIHSRPQEAQAPVTPQGFPNPVQIAERTIQEFSDPFHKHGSNDHGIGWLMLYTIGRFAAGFAAASVVAVIVGVAIGLSDRLYRVLNPVIQLLKPISPLAWMPLLLYTVQDGYLSSVLVVFLAALWPTMANTAFGVHAIRKEYLQVGGMLQLPWWRRLFLIILPATAPAAVAGLRISFGSALIAVVPAEMLLAVLGVGYMTLVYWNNLDLAGVAFGILVIGVIGFCLDLAFNQLSKRVTYSE